MKTLPDVVVRFARSLAIYASQLDKAEQEYDAMPKEYDDDNAYEWQPFRTAFDAVDFPPPQTARVTAFHASLYAEATKQHWPKAAFSALHALEFDLHERYHAVRRMCLSPEDRALDRAEARAEGGA